MTGKYSNKDDIIKMFENNKKGIDIMLHIQNSTMALTVDGVEIELNKNQASGIIVTRWGKNIQLNRMGEGENASVNEIHDKKYIKIFNKLRIKKGAKITMLRKRRQRKFLNGHLHTHKCGEVTATLC